MRVVVTGCAGFIGARVSELLLDEGSSVVGLDNLCSAYDVRLKEYRVAQLQRHTEFAFHRADICDVAALDSLLAAGADAIVHCAARAGVRASVADPQAFIDANVTGTLRVLEACRRHRVGRLVLASTSSLYAGLQAPFSEEQPTNRLLSPYAASKLAAEALAHSYSALHGLHVTVCRFFTVYGPAGRPDMSVLRFVQAIDCGRPLTVYGDGQQQRDFTYIDDIARGVLAAVQRSSGGAFEVINLGSDRPQPLLRVVELLEALLDKRAAVVHRPPHAADPLVTWADVSKARRLLGWQPQVPLEEGLRRTVDWYVRERHWAQHIDTTPE